MVAVVLLLLSLVADSGQASTPFTAQLVGTWAWVEGQQLVVASDGTCRVSLNGSEINTCRWAVLDESRRLLRLTHRSGGWIDTVTLSADGRSLDGTNNRSSKIHGSKQVSSAEVVGTWSWVDGQRLTLSGNGSCRVEAKDGMFLHNCSWVFTPTTAATTIRIDHAGGGWVDTVTLAPDGRSLDGTNNANAKIHGTKQGAFDAALAAALAGSWNWVEGQTLIIAADGTCRVLQAGTEINTCRWEVTDVASRSLRFTHRNGGWVDSVTLSSDGRALDGVNNRNTRLHGEKVR